jgi:nucleotide-binding universal stress UspA family protein
MRNMKILIAAKDLDDGNLASQFAKTWLLRKQRVFYVIHVIETPSALSDFSRSIFDDWRRQVFARARRLVGRLAKPLASHHSRTRAVVFEGKAKSTLLRLISDDRIELTIVAPHAAKRVRRFLLGSVSETILHNSPTSVAIARAGLGRKKRHAILIGLDGSSSAQKAAKWVQSHIVRRCRIYLVYVHEPPDTILDRLSRVNTESSPLLRRAQETGNLRARRSLEKTESLLRARGYGVETVVSEGGPAAEILDLAQRRKVSLIILGSRGLGSFDRYILGSVSSKVARHADCSVIIVK